MNLESISINRILNKPLKDKPLYISLGQDCPYLEQFKNLDQKELDNWIQNIHAKHGVSWSISGDRENRVDLYRQNKQIVREGRTVHLGLDIIAAAGTPLYSPIDTEVVHVEYEKGTGNYGWLIVLKCKVDETALYLLFGHLAKNKLAPIGTKLRAGQVFGQIGDFHENGNWFHHTHMQILTTRGFKEGWLHKALCTPKDLATIDECCPSPCY